jgi:Zn-dependent protease
MPYVPADAAQWIAGNLKNALVINVVLAVFNMLPIPPLDGFNFVQVFLPHAVLARVTRAAPLLGIGLMLLFFTGSVRYLNLPISYCFHFLLGLIS